MSYYYSPTTNSFYPHSMKESYDAAGTWPVNAVALNDEEYARFSGLPPEGMIRAAGADGLPSWLALPPPSEEEQIAAVALKKQDLISQANDFINMRQWPGKAAIGRLNGDALKQYNCWLDYLDALEAVDSSIGLAVSWPVKPE